MRTKSPGSSSRRLPAASVTVSQSRPISASTASLDVIVASITSGKGSPGLSESTSMKTYSPPNAPLRCSWRRAA
jgi:hypothetical protein